MTTKQAALLAAVGTTLELLTFSILQITSLGTSAPLVYVLFVLLVVVSFSAALPVFFVCVYLNEPPLVIPKRLQRPALVTFIAAGLSAAHTTLHQIPSFQYPRGMSGLAIVFGAIVVSLFFFTVARSSAELQGMNLRLKKAAMYVGIVAIVAAVCAIFADILIEINIPTRQALSAARGGPPGTGLWYRILDVSLGSFYRGSLAWFFFLFYKTVPTAQSSQRLSSGE